jgi:RNA-directed DNA polymerase
VTNGSQDPTPAPVSARTKQAGEAGARTRVKSARPFCAEPTVWTEPMLRALEQGVRGDRWFSLIDKVRRPATLRAAWERVHANHGAGGVDGQTVEQFGSRAEEHLGVLHERLKAGTYVPHPVRRVHIPKVGGGMRPLGIPVIRDRVVQTALRFVLEPIFEAEFRPRSYGFRPGRGCKDALREVEHHLRAGYRHVVDVDLKSFFDTIPHDRLMAELRKKVADGAVLRLVEAYLKQDVFDGLKAWSPEEGTPQGAGISPLLANICLHPLDRRMEDAGYVMVRYADDFVVLCRQRAEAERALEEIRAWTSAAGLTLHPEKTRITHVDAPGGFEFLGYRFERGQRWPRDKSKSKLRDAIRAKTPRLNGHSLTAVIASLNLTLRGWFGYFKHSSGLADLDGFVRRRLRAILEWRRTGRAAHHTGAVQSRWTNEFFDHARLFSLEQARVALAAR